MEFYQDLNIVQVYICSYFKTLFRFSDYPFISFASQTSICFILPRTNHEWILFCFLFTFSCPSLTIPGFTHPVAEYFLSDVHEMLGQALPQPRHTQGKRFKPDNSFVKVFLLNIFFVILSPVFLSSNNFIHNYISFQVLNADLLT